MHQVLYRKWRPATFSDITGQPHITKTILKQIQSGRLAHAYLFTGSRGTGKTTCAKILARAVNCEAPQDGEPCNVCPTCLGILNGSIPDVNEIDAASNSGVDNIRALREELVYSPVASRKRVYIIDEVHMLSTGAFNALLKTLEEPPSHVLFILATTETHKVPATIISRCQRFAFRRIPIDAVTLRLRHICEHEAIAIEPAALDLLARMGDGSLRDALSLLEQCADTAGGSAVSEASVRETLGLTGLEDIAQFLHEIGDISSSMRHLDALYQSGMDFSAILGQVSSLLRDLLMGQMLGDLSVTRLPSDEAVQLSTEWSRDRILWALSHLSESINRLSRSADRRLEAEMCLIRLSAPASPDTAPVVPRSTPTMQMPAAVSTPEPAAASPAPEERTEHSSLAPPNADIGTGDTPAARDPRWSSLLTSVNPLNRDALSKAEAMVSGDKLVFLTNDHFIQGVLQQKELQKQIKAFFPGGAGSTAPKKAVKSPANADLDLLIRNAGDLVIEE